MKDLVEFDNQYDIVHSDLGDVLINVFHIHY